LREEKAGGSVPVEDSADGAFAGRSKTEELAAADEERKRRRDTNRKGFMGNKDGARTGAMSRKPGKVEKREAEGERFGNP
jgi:hypothetical protein